MARRLMTPDGIFCSSCGTAGEATAQLCYACGQPFEGDAPGTKCPQCGRAVDEQDAKCPTCGSGLPQPSEAPIPTGDLIKEIKAFRQETREVLGPLEKSTSAMPEETEAALLAELESLWKLSEPFEKVVVARRKRLEQMDKLIAAARRRVRELEASGNPAEVREREELKKQVQEVLMERDEILKIEFGITEMERIYRNIITMQQKELRAKEDALKARLEGFRKEIGMRDEERTALADREADLARKEEELERRMSEFEARMKSLGAPSPPAGGDPQESAKDGPDSGVTREQWLAAQKEIQEALLKLRGTGGEIILPTAVNVRDLRIRLTELEESIEKIEGEKNDLEAELSRLKASEDHVRDVLKEVDELLAKLPDPEIKKFARSEAFKKYEALMESLGL
ncbi:MAG TPA: zinc ribbon domain-containing protein [Thermoplasmata archaeon]|jgi:hypothetical protein|nr:zinc ribbon domain-containing protein [Thermoplasmata archaeon]